MHYVIFASDQDYHRYSYSDLFSESDCEYIVENNTIIHKLPKFLFKLHTSNKTNKWFDLPFKRIWFDFMCNFENHHKEYCFIFFAGTIRFNLIKNGYINFLRKKYPKSTFVCFYQDLVKYHLQELDINTLKNNFDYIYSFDQNDCQKYGLDYHQLVYSGTYISNNINAKNDVYFVGLAKNRLDEILKTFDILTKKGLKCDFHIVGVKKEARVNEDLIDYCDNITYEQNLKYISDTKAILEIMQKDGYGFTLRTCEAIMFDKMLITNNCTIENAPFYSKNNIVLLKEIESFNWDNLKNNNNKYDYKYKENLSPLLFLKELETRIGNII